jgi:electron transport complex protein RnfB
MDAVMDCEQATDERNCPDSNWPIPQINLSLCDDRGLCIKACPNHVLKLDQGKAVVVFPEKCNYSGLCEQACPTKAFTRVFEIIWPTGTDNA